MPASPPPASEHLALREAAPGVWAALAAPAGLAASNAGIVDLGGATLVFDTTFSPASAAELRAAAEQLTGRPATLVLNSHWHDDHVFGNGVFGPDAAIHATAGTLAIMRATTPGHIAEFKQHWPRQLAEWSRQAEAAASDADRREWEDGVRFARAIIATFPDLQLRLPTHTFSERALFSGTRRTAEFITLGGGHTASDAFLWLPADRVLFTGDLLVTGNHPDLTAGDPQRWLAILAAFKALRPSRLVPGHGELAAVADIEALEQYLGHLLQLADEMNARAEPLPAPAAPALLPAFAAAWANQEAFVRNLEFCRKRSAGSGRQ